MRIVERLNQNDAVDENGDVVHIDEDSSVMTNESRIARMQPRRDYEAEIKGFEDAGVDNIRNLADFSRRNGFLRSMTDEVGAANRHEGAYKQLSSGVHINHYRSPRHALELTNQARMKAVKLGELACENCPLVEFCDTNPRRMTLALESPQNRTRFRSRVENPDNDHLCETNLKPGKQNSSIA